MMSSITMTDDAASDPSFAFQGHPLTVTRGHPLPLGACVTPNGVNFALICRHGTAISLVLSEPCSAEIAAEIPLDPLATGPATTGTSGSPACPTSSATAIASTGRRGSGTASTRASSCSTRRRAPCRAAGPGACRGTSPAAAW